jgi:hypothetical protein
MYVAADKFEFICLINQFAQKLDSEVHLFTDSRADFQALTVL